MTAPTHKELFERRVRARQLDAVQFLAVYGRDLLEGDVIVSGYARRVVIKLPTSEFRGNGRAWSYADGRERLWPDVLYRVDPASRIVRK